ncbi:hypothetical protein R1flu_000130 [Riccia fluitans]|uniref:Uncharacterized protein n=1 Tax=Riccia fluitans TaxID=41844 RepID=A0ABD1Y001_9MARC
MEEFFDRLVGSRLMSYEIPDATRTRLVLSFFNNGQTISLRLACRTSLRCEWIEESPPELGHFATLPRRISDVAHGARLELIEVDNIRGHLDPDCGRKMWFASIRLELKWGGYIIILRDLAATGSWPPSVFFREGKYRV